jgi:hypothetical protein
MNHKYHTVYDDNHYRQITRFYRSDLPYLHKDDGPSVITIDKRYPNKNNEAWYLNGVIHRLDGPAIIFTNLDIDPHYYLHGIRYFSFKEYSTALVDLGYKTKDEVLFLYLKWG